MALDAYELCPCGSGKKLKFCCQAIADDMDRVGKQLENRQTAQALQHLEALDRKHPNNSWIVTTRAIVLIELGEGTTARDLLAKFLAQTPDHEFAIVLYATALLQSDGLDASRKAIQRAFQKGAKRFGSMVGGLASAMSTIFQNRGQMLAAREHLALALRLVPEQDRQEIFVRLLQFDNERSIPYPLRSVHPLPALQGDDAEQAEIKKAQKYAVVGCWDVAAELIEKLATTRATDAAAWYTVGLYRAWSGDEAAAAAALHQSAGLQTDRALAVECETLAQLLDWNQTTHRRSQLVLSGVPTSVSRLLTALDHSPRLLRLELPPTGPQGEPLPTAIYQVIDRLKAEIPAAKELTVDRVPTLLAQVSIESEDPESGEKAAIYLEGYAGPGFDEATNVVKAAAGELVDWPRPPEESGAWAPEETLALAWQWAFPPAVPVAMRRRLDQERWRHTIAEVWPNLRLQGLGGKTPREAMHDPALKTALQAAVYVLDAQAVRSLHEIDVAALERDLNLESLPALSIGAEGSLSDLSPFQWLRLTLTELTDVQLNAVVNRALLLHHDRFLANVLKLALERPGCRSELDLERTYMTLTDIERSFDRRPAAFAWLEAGRKAIADRPDNFQQLWSWDLRELLLRLEDPSDPQLSVLADKFVNYYGPKIPQMRPYVDQMFAAAGLPSPFETLRSPMGGAVTAGGLWTPEAAAAAAPAGGSKLWLPGT